MSTIGSLALLIVLSVHGAQGLSCYCPASQCGDIDSLKQKCKGGLVDDVCHCCKTCAKVEGETCGGLWGLDGTCDQDLFCKGSGRLVMTLGICTQKTATTPSTETTEITRWQEILKTTEKAESRDDLDWGSSSEELEPTEETAETEYSSGDDENEFPTTREKLLTTTESSYSGDESGDDSDDENSDDVTEEPTLSEWTWLPTLKPEPTEETTAETEMPTYDPSEDDENENIVMF